MARKKQTSSQRGLEGSGDGAALPWREGMTDREYEWLQNRGVDVERLFKEFFGERKPREDLTPTELGLWRALIELVGLRINVDHRESRQTLLKARSLVISAMKSIPLSPAPPLTLAPLYQWPEAWREAKHVRVMRDEKGNLFPEINAEAWFDKNHPGFNRGGRPKTSSPSEDDRTIARRYPSYLELARDLRAARSNPAKGHPAREAGQPAMRLYRTALCALIREGDSRTPTVIARRMVLLELTQARKGKRPSDREIRRLCHDAQPESA
jgi:hypothetical protein